MCDKKARELIQKTLREKGCREADLGEGTCMCCIQYRPAEFSDHDCGPHMKGCCNPRDLNMFEPKKGGLELTMRVADVATVLKRRVVTRLA